MARQQTVLQRINTELEDGWEACLTPDCRIYYISHKAQTTSWLPPRENWASTSGLPYGWETGVDRHDKEYFINHVERYTTREDPREDPDYVEPPVPREVDLVRDLEKGFGFVAGSEKPVIVRFVTEGGPSEEKLLPGDQILKINGEEVRRAPREKVIELVRSCKQSIVLTVCQPYTDNSNRKSALLTAAKKAKLKSNPSRVRFADNVLVNGASIAHPSPVESYVPFMPNVLKVFLENGQTKSFKYDNKTTVKDVVVAMQEKLNVRSGQHFSLVLQNMKSNTGTVAKMTLLQDHQTLAEIAARQGARYFRCLFRVTFVPRDPYDLLKEDPIAFEYFYLQCCNDVLLERFASEMKYDTALRLAALQVQQHAMSNNLSGKVSIKSVVKECGLEKFVSRSLLATMKGRELKRLLGQYLKMNQSLAAPGQKQLTALQAKLHYMKMVSQLKTFGSRVFMVTLLDQKTEAMLLVGPQSGISIVTNIKSYALTQLADFEQLDQVRVTKDGDGMQRVDLRLKPSVPPPPSLPSPPSQPLGEGGHTISLGLLSEDAHNLVCLVSGYFRLFVDTERRLVERTLGKNTTDPDVPSYESVHRVVPSPWAFSTDLVSEVVSAVSGPQGHPLDSQRVLDLTHDPPAYQYTDQYLARVKQDLGIESSAQMTSRADPAAKFAMARPRAPSDVSGQVKVNGSAPLFKEGVTSFGASGRDPGVAGHNGSPAGRSGPACQAAVRKAVTSTSNGHALTAGSRRVDGEVQPGGPDSERSSDTDSLSTVDTERRPLLNQIVAHNGDARHGEGESDDTDSVGTPGSSPAKGRHMQRVSSVESGMHSFGLHSPDVLPTADVDFDSLGDLDLNRLPPSVYSAIYRPDAPVILPQRLYLDPDIIDLTIFPLPDSALDDDAMMDFTALPSLPPPSFATPHPTSAFASSPAPLSHHPNGTTPASDPSHGYPGSGPGSQPGLTRSASADHCPDFFDNDIDALIAQYYVPPPPSSTHLHADHSQVLSQSFSGAASGPSPSCYMPPDDDDFSSLIIPPPPPPSSSYRPQDLAASSVPTEAKERRRHFHHKRSSSVDLGALNLAKQQLLEADRRRSLDSQKKGQRDSHTDNHQDSRQQGGVRKSAPPDDLQGVEQSDSDAHDSLAAESPATVSMKLHNLLKSLPNLAPEVDLAGQEQPSLHRTGSLRIHRSASLDAAPITAGSAEAAQTFTGKATQRTFFTGTVSLGRITGRRVMSHQNLASSADPADTGKSESGQQQSSSEGFASLKAKLKDYRDQLLRRTSHSRRQSADESSSDNGDRKKSSLRRSNSFSRLLAQFSGRRGSKSSEPIVVGDGNWTLRQRDSLTSSTGDLTATSASLGGEEERRGTPVVRETFAVPRVSLRPVSSTSDAAQNKSKKSGPLKALSSVFSNDERSGDSGENAAGHRKGSSSHSRTTGFLSSTKNSPSSGSKDDLSILTQDGGKKSKMKANPYATTKMWRPITMTSSLSRQEEVFHSFTNFDVLVDNAQSLPATRDQRSENPRTPAALSRTISSPITANEFQASLTGDSSPLDYHPGSSSPSPAPSASYRDEKPQTAKKRLEPRRSAPPVPFVGSSEATVKRPATRSSSSSAVTIPLRSRSLTMEETLDSEMLEAPSRRSRASSRLGNDSPFSAAVNGAADIPVDYPQDSASSSGSQRSRSLSEGSRGRGRSVMDSSCDVVGLEVSASVKHVLSKTYGMEEFQVAIEDVESMLGQLKGTMDNLKSLQAGVFSSGSQFQTVRQELQLQTKQFVQDAKCVVACANGPRHAAGGQLGTAMQTLGRVLLHGQATMIRMQSVHQAQHVGFELMKVATSFKSTVAAASAAQGKPTADPHMKYLMRQATNLAGLLSTLLKTLKNLEQT